MIRVITHELIGLDVGFSCTMTGNTTLTSHTSDGDCSFQAHPWYHRKPWYDWAYVSFIEQIKCGDDQENLYPSKILRFFKLPYDMVQCAVVQCSVSPVPWDILERKFILEFNLGTCFNVSFVIVPVSSIVHPLCVFPNYGSNDSSSFFVVLPKQNWSN
jgi:hypothetical protein